MTIKLTRMQVLAKFAAAFDLDQKHRARIVHESTGGDRTRLLGHADTVDLEVNGTRLGWRLSLREGMEGSFSQQRPSGQWHVSIRLGSYGYFNSRTHAFPQRKDGTFDTARALPVLVEAAEQNAAAYASTTQRAVNTKAAHSVQRALGIDPLGMRHPFNVAASDDPRLSVEVHIDTTMKCTPEAARLLFRRLMELGVPVLRKPREEQS